MEETNRCFGIQIQNVVNNNHIVLRANSFSFKDKNKIYANDQSTNVLRRQSVVGYQPKTRIVPELVRRQNTSEVLARKLPIEPIIVTERQLTMEATGDDFLQDIKDDKQFIPQYVKNCIDHLISQQSKRKIKVEQIRSLNPHYIKNRPQIIDWIARIHSQMKLFHETFSISVGYLDKYLSRQKAEEKQFSNIALVCLFIASKVQQVYNAPNIKSLIQISRLKLQVQKVIQMEQKILSALQFQLIFDSPIKYVQLFSRISNLSKKNECIVHYFVEMCLLDSSFIQYTPSKLASSAIYLIHKIRKISPAWPKALKQLTGYSQADLNNCTKLIYKLMQKDNTHFGFNIRKKFSKPELCCASTVRMVKRNQQN